MDVREKLADMLFAEIYSGGIICDGNTYKQVRAGFIKIADHLIAHGVTVQEWISVKDRLPEGAKDGETSENVIALTIDGEVTTGWMDALGSDKWWLVIGTDDTHTCWGLGYVTHWMPLPEPPKGE